MGDDEPYDTHSSEGDPITGHSSISDTLKCEQCVPTEKLIIELTARGFDFSDTLRKMYPMTFRKVDEPMRREGRRD